MLKRYQVLIEDWLGEHFKAISKKYDISFSEAIRIILCLQVPKLAKIAHPKCRTVSLDKEMVKTIKKASKSKIDIVNFHKLLSRIYFEARKTVEIWTKEEERASRAAYQNKRSK